MEFRKLLKGKETEKTWRSRKGEKRKGEKDARVFVRATPVKRVIIITEDKFNVWSIIVLCL